MQDKPVALVTGANQGIGLQIAKDLAAHGFTVLVGSRNLERGEAAAKEIGPDAHALQLDVTDQASIAAAAERIRERARPPRRARQQRGHLEYGQATRHVRRGVREVDPPRATCPSTRCARSGRPTCSASSPSPRRCCRSCARPPAGPHRQRVERRRLADHELGPGLPVPLDLRPGLPRFQDGPQRHDGRHGDRAGVDRDQGQRRCPGYHQDEPQQLFGHADPRGGRPRAGARLRCSARTARRARSRTHPGRSPGDPQRRAPRSMPWSSMNPPMRREGRAFHEYGEPVEVLRLDRIAVPTRLPAASASSSRRAD